jgi:hypothetical protein
MSKPLQHMRNGALDAIKTWLTILVIFHHTAITYGSQGGWFYKEVLPSKALSSLLLVYFCTINQAYFMGFFFLMAGYFTLPSLLKKGTTAFIRDRLIRLWLPLLFFGFVLGPITIAIAATAKDKPLIDVLLWLWQRGWYEPGPLWFAQALLVFSALALVAHRLIDLLRFSLQSIPSNRSLALWAVACGLIAFLIRLIFPVGAEFWHLQLGYFPMYVLLFSAGCLAAQHNWLERITEQTATTWRRVALWTLPTIIPLGFLSKAFPIFQGSPLGGWNIPALMYAMWEPFVAWCAILWLLYYAHKRHSIQSPFSASLARRTFCVFVIHPVVVVGVSVAWRTVQAPALLKFLVTGSLSTVICFVLAGWILKLPWMNRVL